MKGLIVNNKFDRGRQYRLRTTTSTRTTIQPRTSTLTGDYQFDRESLVQPWITGYYKFEKPFEAS